MIGILSFITGMLLGILMNRAINALNERFKNGKH